MRAEPASFNIVNAHHLLSQLLLEYRGCFGDALRDPLAACARLRAAVLLVRVLEVCGRRLVSETQILF